MEPRREEFCGGRLVKETDQINVGTSWDPNQYTDGRHIWLLDGEEVDPREAAAFRLAWQPDPAVSPGE